MTLSVLWCPDPDPDPRRHGPLSAARFALLASVCAECLHYVLDMEAGATELAFQNGKRDCNENGELLDSRKEFIQVNGIIGGRTRGKRLEDFHRPRRSKSQTIDGRGGRIAPVHHRGLQEHQHAAQGAGAQAAASSGSDGMAHP